ncbi:hypothetical protein PMAG_a0581 [Pseudoalteromonas mariniglutinosa NCIMB 1770]|nr:hypothetical protein [Pseudoalteromonas mariniglutinosa NCIMB 1770]
MKRPTGWFKNDKIFCNGMWQVKFQKNSAWILKLNLVLWLGKITLRQ